MGGRGRGQASEQPRLLLWHRIMPPVTPRMTAHQSAHRQIGAYRSAVFLQRFKGISRTSRFKPANRAQPGAQHQTIAAHQGHEQALHHGATPSPDTTKTGASCALLSMGLSVLDGLTADFLEGPCSAEFCSACALAIRRAAEENTSST